MNKRQAKKKRKNIDRWHKMEILGYKKEKKLNRDYRELCICWEHIRNGGKYE
ncbi:MAG: hypothetical protein E6357_07395 [Clostridiales bacterium]|nr:hypothetical protein [Clostridiales bacterium]